jgi:hypothetical protein
MLRQANGRLTDAARGYIIAPLAATDTDVQWLRQHAEKDLNAAVATFADRQQVPPVVVVLPKKPHDALLNGLMELDVLGGLSEAQKRTLGTEPINQRKITVRNKVQEALEALKEELRRAADYVVPTMHRSGIETRLTGKNVVNLARILQAAYETVYYRFAPYLGESTRGKLREAVGLAAVRLYKGNFLDWAEATERGNLGRARDLYHKVLRIGSPSSWAVIDTSERVMAPKLPVVKQAWEVLEAAVPPGAENQPLRPALLQLLNAPYGYDPWALGLLFATWYGVNRHQLRITDSQGKSLDYKTWLGTSNDFRGILESMLHTHDLRATRRDEETVEGEVQEMVTKLRWPEPMALADAEIALQKLTQYVSSESSNSGLREEAKQAAEQLSHEVKQAEEYEKRITEGTAALDTVPTSATGVKQLIDLCQLFSNPTKAGVPLGRVIPTSQATIGQTQKRASAKLRPLLSDVCTELADITSLRSYDLNKNRLAGLLTLVAPLSEPDLERRIRDAQQVLEDHNDVFSKESLDSDIRDKVTEVRRANSLADWRELLAYFAEADPKADSTVALVANATITLNTKCEEAETWLASMQERANALIEASAIRTFEGDLNRRTTQFEGTDEAKKIKALALQADGVSKLLSNLKQQRREKTKTADDVRRVVREYKRLAEGEGLSGAQIAFIDEERAEFERRFDEQRQAASQKLDELINSNEAKDAPALLLAELERRLEFLPDEDKPRRDALEKDLRRRVAKSKASLAEKAFLDIGSRSEQKALLTRLQQLLEQQPA